MDIMLTNIEPGLFLSGIHSVQELNLIENQIKFVLSVTASVSKEEWNLQLPSTVIHKVLPVLDEENELIMCYFDECYEIINNMVENHGNGSILVHCNSGISRSPTIVIAFLMKKYKISYLEALSKIDRYVAPNKSFVNQLKLYQKMGYSLSGTTRFHLQYQQKLVSFQKERKKTKCVS